MSCLSNRLGAVAKATAVAMTKAPQSYPFTCLGPTLSLSLSLSPTHEKGLLLLPLPNTCATLQAVSSFTLPPESQ